MELKSGSVKNAAFLAFNELEHALLNKPRLIDAKMLSELPAKAPLFVTWTKHDQLRGCIGTFSDQPLYRGIREYALIAALQDTRFHPIIATEIPDLEVAVTILGKLEKCETPFDWEIGHHGVKAVFANGASATYLPEVAEEQGWSKEETIEALADKAGVSSTKGIVLYRYTGLKKKVTYKDYVLKFGNKSI